MRSRVDPAVQYVPGRRRGHLPGPQLVEGVALGWVPLADVLGEGKDATRVTAGQGFEGTPGPHGVQLAVVAHDDGPCPGGRYCPEQLGHFGVGGHAALVHDEHMTGAEGLALVLQAPGERRHRTRADTGTFLQGFGRLARGGRPDDGVAGGFEAGPHGRQGRGFAAPGHPDQQVKRVPGSEQLLGHFGLSLIETGASGQFRPQDRADGHLDGDGRRPPLDQLVGQLGHPALVFQHAGGCPHRPPGTGHRRQGDGPLVGKDLLDCGVQY